MESETSGQDEEEANNRIFQPDIEPTLTDKDERKFFAWHKPRKQYLRIKQWCAVVRHLIQQNKYQEGDVIRYLGFPGEDFLDIRVLQGVFEKKNLKLRYLGFDRTASYAGREFQFNLAKHEVFQLGFIQTHSYVLKDDFCVLAKMNSIAYRETSKFRDFDVINIDLCDSMASPSDVEYPPYFEAIKRLCDLQVIGRTRPWVLFLTTRAIRDQIDTKTKRKLFDCVIENINGNGGFAKALEESLDLNSNKIHGELSETTHLGHAELVNLFGLAIGKWLLSMMMKANPKSLVRLLRSYSYRVQVAEPDMLSLAFLFEPHVTPPIDNTGLTPTAPQRDPHPGECQLAIELLSACCQIEDIDTLLHMNETIYDKMVNMSADLLASVRYDQEKYREWAETQRWRPS